MSKIEATLEERSKTHGSFEKNAEVVQHFKNWAKVAPKYNALSDSAKEALDNILQKIGRILTGDPTHIDSWHDIAGYATLERDILISKQTVAIDPKHLVVDEETQKELARQGIPSQTAAKSYYHGSKI